MIIAVLLCSFDRYTDTGWSAVACVYLRGTCLETPFCSKVTRIGFILSYLSGMSKQTSFFPFRNFLNFFETLFLWDFSITKMMSAHSIRSPLTGVSASLFVPAPIALMPSYFEKTSSPVGLLSLFSLQINNRFMRFSLAICVETIVRQITSSLLLQRALLGNGQLPIHFHLAGGCRHCRQACLPHKEFRR